MLPGALGEAVIERQVRDIEAEIGRALDVGVAAEDVGAGAGLADIAGQKQRDAGGAHVGGADGLLRLAHAPDQGRRLLRREFLRDALQLLAGHAGDALDLLRRILLDLLDELLDAVDALADEFLVLPAVLHDVPHHPHEERNIRAGPQAHVFGRVRRRAREARIGDDEVRAVQFLAGKEMLDRDRMRLGRIAAEEEHGLGVAQVVVGIRLGAVAPGVGDARDRRRVADAGLVIDGVRAPIGGELAEQIGALVGELRRAEPVDGIRAGGLSDLHHLVADLVDRLIPRDALPLAADELHRIFQAAVAVHELAHGGALGAMGAAVDRAFPGRLLADPDAVLHLGGDRAADRAMGADVLLDLDLRAGRCRPGLRLAHRAKLDRSQGRERADGEPGALEEGAAIDGLRGQARGEILKPAAARFAALALDQHRLVLTS